MFKGDHGGVKPMPESSMKQNTAVGGGSRPTTSKVLIETSAPMNAHQLDRAPAGWLK
jgi:hypothetical protein